MDFKKIMKMDDNIQIDLELPNLESIWGALPIMNFTQTRVNINL